MRIWVLVKLSLDTSQLRFSGDRVLIEETPLRINDIDRNAVEEAVRLKERGIARNVNILTVLKYPPLKDRVREAEGLIRQLLAMGADEAYIIADDGLLLTDPMATSLVASEVIKANGYDIIIAGEASIDGYSGQVPVMVAARLGIPVITYVKELKVENGVVTARRDLDNETQLVSSRIPLVVSVTREINMPRIPTVIQIRLAIKKPIKLLTLSDINVKVNRVVNVKDIRAIQVNRKGVIIDSGSVEEKADKLIDYLIKDNALR
jgi:electron transfer flavoprotein beta subunit